MQKHAACSDIWALIFSELVLIFGVFTPFFDANISESKKCTCANIYVFRMSGGP